MAAQPPVYAGAARLDTQAVFLGQPFNCSSPLPVFWILPAAWQLQVVGVDGAGNKAAPQNADWTVAFVAGQQYTRFLEGPYGRQPKTNLTFTLRAFDSTGAQLPAPGGFECWLESTAGVCGNRERGQAGPVAQPGCSAGRAPSSLRVRLASALALTDLERSRPCRYGPPTARRWRSCCLLPLQQPVHPARQYPGARAQLPPACLEPLICSFLAQCTPCACAGLTCSSSLSSLQDGDYRFHARLAGVAPSDGTEAVSNLTIDSVAPTVTITGPQGRPWGRHTRRGVHGSLGRT